MTCIYATDTGRKWCDCLGMTCTEIECRNPTRLKAILPGAEGRADAANYHTKYAPQDANDRANASFVLVRSRYCCENHCVDFTPREETDPQKNETKEN